MKLKSGNIVTRKSYGKDILFYIDKIINLKNNKKLAILKGIVVRIEADALIEDLEIASMTRINNAEKRINEILLYRLDKLKNIHGNYIIRKGKILHLDGVYSGSDSDTIIFTSYAALKNKENTEVGGENELSE